PVRLAPPLPGALPIYAMLVEMAGALGRVHARGLCHGRPHPRDLFRTADGRWGYLDFEEEPEASMPLAAAQAREVWLMFMEIAGRDRKSTRLNSSHVKT